MNDDDKYLYPAERWVAAVILVGMAVVLVGSLVLAVWLA